MTQRSCAHPETSLSPKEPSPWAKLTFAELETKRHELRKLIMLTDRSMEHQFTEAGIIENELARRDGG